MTKSQVTILRTWGRRGVVIGSPQLGTGSNPNNQPCGHPPEDPIETDRPKWPKDNKNMKEEDWELGGE